MAYLTNAEIKELSKSLASAINENRADAKEILEKLKTGVEPKEDIIRATKIGQAVSKARAHEDKIVSQLAKDLVRIWKSKVDSQREAKKKESSTASASPATTVASPPPPPPIKPVATTKTAVTPSPSLDEESNKKAPINFDNFNDKTRNTCLKIIYQALEVDSEDLHNVFERAKDVEVATFRIVGKGEVNNDYRQKMRSLSLNLKDKKNPSLRQGVVKGIIDADKLVTMSPEEMASDEKKAEREALQMQNLFKAKAAAAQEAETDAFVCGKCHQRKCTYYQKQTRSADEPMTTFVTCTNCLNKWKFC